MTQALLDYSRETLRTHGIVDSGDAAEKGIGAMTDERWRDFYADTERQGLYPAGLDVTRRTRCNSSTRASASKPRAAESPC